jgi:hypothetical protein
LLQWSGFALSTSVTGISVFHDLGRVRIRGMRKLLAGVLMLGVLASPALAAKKPHKQPHPKYDYRYHTPKKYKVSKQHVHGAHPHNNH